MTTEAPSLPAVLFAVAGTTCPCAEVAYRGIEEALTAQCPGIAVGWAYTSGGVRRKLAQQGRGAPAAGEALAALKKAGVRRVVIEPLHMAPGMEFSELRADVDTFMAGPDRFESVAMGRPFLASDADTRHAAAAILAEFAIEPGKGDALVLVAHGSRQPAAQTVYEHAAAVLAAMEGTPVFLGALMGKPAFGEVLRACRAAGVRRVWLAPLTAAAGNSARKDLAGNDAASWRQRFTAGGIRAVPLIRGLGEYPAIAGLWAAHVLAAIGRAPSRPGL